MYTGKQLDSLKLISCGCYLTIVNPRPPEVFLQHVLRRGLCNPLPVFSIRNA